MQTCSAKYDFNSKIRIFTCKFAGVDKVGLSDYKFISVPCMKVTLKTYKLQLEKDLPTIYIST